jgi:hypothetical protein
MNLAQRCDEIIRMIDEVLAAEASAEFGTRSAHPPEVALDGATCWPGHEARR